MTQGSGSRASRIAGGTTSLLLMMPRFRRGAIRAAGAQIDGDASELRAKAID